MKILIIAYHFPPDAAVGALRPQKFVKYLPEFGWQPYVLTIENRYIDKVDPARLADVSDVPICRTTFIRTPFQFLLDARDRLFRRGHRSGGGGPPAVAVAANKASGSGAGSGEAGGGRPWLLRLLISLNWLPDDKLFWTVPALVRGFFLVRREQIRVIYATAPPHSALLPAVLLARLTGCRLVLDFRDPWTENIRLPENMATPLYYRLSAQLERWTVRGADRVVVVTDRFRRHIMTAYPAEPAAKFRVVENGYDDSDIVPERREKPSGKFTISYLGTFYLDRNPQTVLRALSLLVAERFWSRDDFEVRFIGSVSHLGGVSVQAMIDEAGLSGTVTLVGALPYAEALREMAQADLLLLLAPNQPNQVPAKSYEYLATGNPVLALTGEGATADLVRRTGCGIVVDPGDVAGIVAALRELYLSRETDRFRPSPEERRRFTRRELTGRLAKILDELQPEAAGTR